MVTAATGTSAPGAREGSGWCRTLWAGVAPGPAHHPGPSPFPPGKSSSPSRGPGTAASQGPAPAPKGGPACSGCSDPLAKARCVGKGCVRPWPPLFWTGIWSLTPGRAAGAEPWPRRPLCGRGDRGADAKAPWPPAQLLGARAQCETGPPTPAQGRAPAPRGREKDVGTGSLSTVRGAVPVEPHEGTGRGCPGGAWAAVAGTAHPGLGRRVNLSALPPPSPRA